MLVELVLTRTGFVELVKWVEPAVVMFMLKGSSEVSAADTEVENMMLKISKKTGIKTFDFRILQPSSTNNIIDY